MFVSIALGIVFGVIGALPFFLSERLRKSRLRKGKDTTVGFMVMLAVASFVFFSVAILLCYLICKEAIVSFSIALLVTLIVGVLILTIFRVRRF